MHFCKPKNDALCKHSTYLPVFQIWFYTNDIFENAGISVSQVQYTTVGTGAIEVIAGLIGVRKHSHYYSHLHS